MGHPVSKQPIRTLLSTNEAQQARLVIPTETQPGHDSLEVPETEENYPEVRPVPDPWHSIYTELPVPNSHTDNTHNSRKHVIKVESLDDLYESSDLDCLPNGHRTRRQQHVPNGHIGMHTSTWQQSPAWIVRRKPPGIIHKPEKLARKPISILDQMLERRNKHQHVAENMVNEKHTSTTPLKDHVPLDYADYALADKQARKHQRHPAKTYSSLTRDLTSAITSEAVKVLAIIAWISRQGIGKLQFDGKQPSPTTPNGYMQLMQEGQGTYSAFFALLCRSCGIPCAIIHGVSKCTDLDICKDYVDVSSSWNAVFVGGGWRLVHPLLACTSQNTYTQCRGPKTGKDVMPNTNDIAARNESITIDESTTCNRYYIFNNPKEFIYSHFPDNAKWQLLDKQWTKNEFISRPFLRPRFFKERFRLLSEEKRIIVSESGESVDIVVGFPLQHRDLVFTYEFQLLLYAPDPTVNKHLKTLIPVSSPTINTRNCDRFVVMLKHEDRVQFGIRFPTKGKFRFRLHCGHSSTYKLQQHWAADLCLICKDNILTPHPIPFDPGILAWGPGPMTERIGLHVPSHEEGTVFIKDDEQTLIQFILVNWLRIRVQMHHWSVSCERLQQYVHYDVVAIQDNYELRVVVLSPGTGEYALEISVFNKLTQMFENACNYLVHTRPTRAHESYYMRNARRLLLDANLACDVTLMEAAMAMCQKHGIRRDDPEIVSYSNKLTFLQCRRALRDSLVKNRKQLVEESLMQAREAGLGVVLSRYITRAEQHLKQLHLLGEDGWHSQIPEIDRSSLMELSLIRNPKPEVRQVVTAMLLLLGNREKDLKSWTTTQRLLRHQEDTLLRMASLARMARLNLITTNVDVPIVATTTLQRVQRILDTIAASDVKRIDSTAAAYHNWLKQRLLNTELEVTEYADAASHLIKLGQ